MTGGAEVDEPEFITLGEGERARRIAYRRLDGATPMLFWLGGYRSDMLGTKAEALAEHCAKTGTAFCRFDYFGHGESSGRFADGTISLWLEDARAVLETVTKGPVVLVGSSMGAWIALRLVQMLRGGGSSGTSIAGLLLLAPAPDFTHRLLEPELTPGQREALAGQGYFTEASEYSPEPNIYTRALFEDARGHLVMDGVIDTGCPVHIIQGMNDPDVPFTHALDLVGHLPADAVVVTLVRDADHRLSRREDIERMLRAASELVQRRGAN